VVHTFAPSVSQVSSRTTWERARRALLDAG
jgi:hypothetical protein